MIDFKRFHKVKLVVSYGKHEGKKSVFTRQFYLLKKREENKKDGE
jgi:hypothetical protein